MIKLTLEDEINKFKEEHFNGYMILEGLCKTRITPNTVKIYENIKKRYDLPHNLSCYYDKKIETGIISNFIRINEDSEAIIYEIVEYYKGCNDCEYKK